MAELFLKEIKCRYCGQCFFICHSCWRCQAYCSTSCKLFGYRRCRQKRQAKYRNTDRGKKTRRKFERKRSLGMSARYPGDATSNAVSSVLPSSENQSAQQPCCQRCGKNGHIVNHFPPRRYGNRSSVVLSNYFFSPGGHYDTENPTRQSSDTVH